MQLRPKEVAANQYWRDEETGCGAGIVLLRAPTISSRWRAQRDPWADALVALPRPMRGPRGVDTAEELSEDESDTEVEFALPTEQRLREIFVIPTADGRFPKPGEEEAAEAEGSADAAAAPEVDVGVSEGWVAPERVLPLDTGSELAMAEAELQKEQNEVRKKLRTQLREKMEALNELIEPPRFKLSLA